MKKSLLLITLYILAVLTLSSCQPLEVSTYCLASYKQLNQDYPGFPESYIGFCISSLQTGSFHQFAEICEHSSVWDVIEKGWFDKSATIYSTEECIDYFEMNR
ncbi:hypothetical protein JR338_11975 [Chloroflexota bacterium]|nr:hypothetical protein JR338_11975 [Chloroflexota bacterium]